MVKRRMPDGTVVSLYPTVVAGVDFSVYSTEEQEEETLQQEKQEETLQEDTSLVDSAEAYFAESAWCEGKTDCETDDDYLTHLVSSTQVVNSFGGV